MVNSPHRYPSSRPNHQVIISTVKFLKAHYHTYTTQALQVPTTYKMPTYQINSTLIFTPAQKASVAEQITNAHCTLTGADRVAVQVIFRQLAAEDHYHGGARTADAVGTLVWVHAICKAGRSQGLKDEIMSKVCEVIVGELGVHKRQVLLYMQELDIGNALQSFDDQCLVKKD